MILLLSLAVCGLVAVCYVQHLRISALERKLFDDSESLND